MDEQEEVTLSEQFFAKLSGKRGEHLLVFSDRANMAKDKIQSYASPSTPNAVAFEPGRSLHDDEWFKIELDSAQVNSMIQPYIVNAKSNVDNRTIQGDDYEKVVALYKTNGSELTLTKVTGGNRVESKTFIGLNDHPELKSYNKAIEFTGYVDAYFDGENALYFKSYSKIRTLFTGIEVFYRNATEGEKTTFLSKEFFSAESMDTSKIGMRDSQKIASILDDERIQLDDTEFQAKVVSYAREFVPSVLTDDGKLKIEDKETLHGTLNLLTERYYTSKLFGDKREAIDSAKLPEAGGQQP